MQQSGLINKLSLKNFLSYGSDGEEVELNPLNVLIGANASGKSNLIEAFRILQSIPQDLAVAIRKGGGIREWLWKGEEVDPIAEIEAIVSYSEGARPLRYKLGFTAVGQKLEVISEIIENESRIKPSNKIVSFYQNLDGQPIRINARVDIDAQAGTKIGRKMRRVSSQQLKSNQSIISQRQDVDNYPEITYLGEQFSGIWLYTDWSLGRNTPVRLPQPTDEYNGFLFEDASNLGLVLNNLRHQSNIWHFLIENFKKFYDTANDITTRVEGGTIQIFIHEIGLRHPIPAIRLSDGTLNYLCLLAILCHPNPPPLICLEEPELGLHPDVLPTIAQLLVGASQHTQLVVTTHSDVLVSALTGTPESVLVCEQNNTGSHLHRLKAESLKKWLENYSLGELWRMGEIGGTRW